MKHSYVIITPVPWDGQLPVVADVRWVSIQKDVRQYLEKDISWIYGFF